MMMKTTLQRIKVLFLQINIGRMACFKKSGVD